MKPARKDNPSSIFYWKDYENDEGLRVSSLAAQGLWMRLLCVAAKADPYGYVLINGCEIGVTGAARLGSVSEAEAATLMDELERNGVFSRDRKGRVFCRRMVKDDATRKKNAKNGKKGGNPALSVSGGKEKEKDRSLNPPDNPPLKPPYPLPHTPSDTSYPHSKQQQCAGDDPPQVEWSPDRLCDEVMAAVGLGSGRIPTHWMPPAAPIHVWRWHTQLGLSPEQIVDGARQNRAKFDAPPDGPKALDRAMQRLSAEISAPPLQPAASARASPPRSNLDAIAARLQAEFAAKEPRQ